MKLQKLYSYTRKAMDDFQMIKENDSIAVGISGGKDSLTLLYALAGLRRFYPVHYSLTAITVDLGYPDFDLTEMFEGRFYTFPPVTHLDRSNLDVIRPLMYVPEVDVIGFKNHYNLPVVKNPCTFDGKTKRQYAKDLLQQLNKDHPGVKNRLFTAIINGNIPDWRQLSNE